MKTSLGPPPPRWLPTNDAAEQLGITPRTVYAIINRGELAAYRIGRVMRIQHDDIDAYLDRQRIHPGDLDHLLGLDGEGPEVE